MKASKKIITYIVIILVMSLISSLSTYAQSKEDTLSELSVGYKGVKWGATKEEFLSIRPGIDLDHSSEDFLGYEVDEVYYRFVESTGEWSKLGINTSNRATWNSIISELERAFPRVSETQTENGMILIKLEKGDIRIWCLLTPGGTNSTIQIFNTVYDDSSGYE